MPFKDYFTCIILDIKEWNRIFTEEKNVEWDRFGKSRAGGSPEEISVIWKTFQHFHIICIYLDVSGFAFSSPSKMYICRQLTQFVCSWDYI